MRSLAAAFLLVLAVASSTHAAGLDLTFASAIWPACRDDDGPAAQDAGQPLHAAAVQHSDAYQTRAKIHKVASYATLPLFGAELLLGESLYNTPVSGATRTGHIVVGTGIVGLFGVNTVTGAWNLFGEGWSEKDGRTLRLIHGLLMMVSDAGFVATTMTGPNDRARDAATTFDANKARHRNLAIASISVGTAGYLLMLFGNH